MLTPFRSLVLVRSLGWQTPELTYETLDHATNIEN